MPLTKEIKIGDKLHRVVYIEYNDGLPHLVMTIAFIDTAKEPYWRLCWWDFFANNGDKKDIQAYNSGSGGDHKSIQAPNWVDGYIGKYWIADDARFEGTPKNAMRLKNPLRVKGYFGNKSINPFNIAEITHNMEYCERCGFDSIDFCTEHKFIDEKGNVLYIDDNSSAE